MLIPFSLFLFTSLSLPSSATPIASRASPSNCSAAPAVNWRVNCTTFGYNATTTITGPAPDCGYFTVPLDYADCSPGNVTLAVARRNATVSPRLGTIFVNPGGPGGQGVDYVFTTGELLRNMTGGQYDIVSWDPRGIGYTSLLVDCYSNVQEQLALLGNNSILLYSGVEAFGNFTNQNGTDPDELAALAKEPNTDTLLDSQGALCTQKNGNNLKYVGTVAAVRDMLSLSDAIEGPGKAVNYWGVSYGTVIGSYFINMFPQRVGRVVVDGVVNPILWASQPTYNIWPYAIQDVELVFNEFTSSCAAAGPLCAIGSANSTQASIAAYVQSFMDEAFKVFQTNQTSQVNSALLRSIFFGGLYTPAAWPTFTEHILQLRTAFDEGGDISSALDAFGELSPFAIHPTGPFIPTRARTFKSPSQRLKRRGLAKRKKDESTFDFAPMAIECGDAADPGNTTTHDIFNELLVSANVSQMFGPAFAAAYRCHKWPARAVERYQGPWNASLTNPVLVIGNEGDPVTSLAGAETVAAMLGKSAVLLRRNGYGHSSLAEISTCTNSVLTAFFRNGTTPTPGTVCSTDRNYFGSPSTTNDSSTSTLLSSTALPTSTIYHSV